MRIYKRQGDGTHHKKQLIADKIENGEVFFMEPEIIVYDDKRNQMGKTFARRAKQLVGKGRAVWMYDSQRAIILAAGVDVSEVYASNDGGCYVDLRPESEELGLHEAASDDDMLRHLARARVRRKKALRWHVAGVFGASNFIFVFFLIATGGFWRVTPVGWLMFGFCYGVIAVWVVWVARQIAAAWRERSLRPNEVEKEFQRLKSMHTRL